MTIIKELQKYYADLLIIQYQKKKARKEIELYVKALFPANQATGNLLIDDIENSFSLNTAQGVQLDILGQYVGLSRFFVKLEYREATFFSFISFDDKLTRLDEGIFGFQTYDSYDTDEGDTLIYDDIGGTSASVPDQSYADLLKLKTVLNNSNGSRASINKSLFNFFGNDVYVESSGAMKLLYFYNPALEDTIDYARQKGLLPKPAGVQIIGYIENIEGGYISMITHSTNSDVFDAYTGLATYDDYDFILGGVLSYKNLK